MQTRLTSQITPALQLTSRCANLEHQGESSVFHIYILTVNEVKRAEVNASPADKCADSAVLGCVLNITNLPHCQLKLYSNWELVASK